MKKLKGITFIIPWEGKEETTMSFMKEQLISNSEKYKEIKFIISCNKNINFEFDWIATLNNVSLVFSESKIRLPLISKALNKVNTDFFAILDLDDAIDVHMINEFINSKNYDPNIDSYRSRFFPLVDSELYKNKNIEKFDSTYFYSGVKWFITANSIFNSKLINKKLIKSLKNINFMAMDDVALALAISFFNNKSLSIKYNKIPFYYHLMYGEENHSSQSKSLSKDRFWSLLKVYRYFKEIYKPVNDKLLNKDYKYCMKLLLNSLVKNATWNDFDFKDVYEIFNLDKGERRIYEDIFWESKIKIKDENVINFVLFTNRKFLSQTKVLINSINRRYKKEEYTINLGITNDCLDHADQLKKMGVKFKVVEKYIENPNEIVYDHVTRITFSRLYMFEIFSELFSMDKKRLIYIDVDTILVRRIDKRKYFDSKDNLAFTDMPNSQNFEMISGWLRWRLENQKQMLKNNLEKLERGNYLNAGVIVINDHKKVKTLFEKCIEYGLVTDDQNLINSLNDGHILVKKETDLNFQPYKEKYRNNVQLIHFTGSTKPWDKEYKKYSNEPDYENIYNIYKNENRKIKILILEEDSEAIHIVKNELINSEELNQIADITLSRDVDFDYVEPWFEREDIVKSDNPKNRKIISSYDVVLSQSYLIHVAPEYRKDNESTTIIEFFHGTIVKDPIDISFADNKVDYFISPNLYTTEVLKSIGYDEQFILKTGYPRLDYYLSISDQASNNHETEYNNYLINKIGIEKFEKKKILFAPSWLNTKENLLQKVVNVNINSILEKMDLNEEILIISKHLNQLDLKNVNYVYDEKYSQNVIENGVDFERVATYQIMMSADKMITDFSSVAFDFGTLKGFDKISFFNPMLDKNQDEQTRKAYAKNYSSYGKFNKYREDFFKIDQKDYENLFKFYNNEYMKPTREIVNFILNISKKKYEIKNTNRNS